MTRNEDTTNAIPQQFNEAFLHWFRDQTEDTWRNYHTRTFEQFVASRVGGRDWQQGTRWLNGLSEQEIAAIEEQYHPCFPPDYRLFLKILHSVDRPLVGARYSDDRHMMPTTTPSFYNWQTDTEAIEGAYEWLVEGLFFDVQHTTLWPQSWGAKPTEVEAQEARVRDLVKAAPRLVPVFGHRYLLAEPCEAGNPVLSIYQSDMIIYGIDLRHYFLTEFGELVGIGREDIGSLQPASEQEMQERFEKYQTIPFWGEFLF
jgi:hypothetical protein